jgi:hypothetical protein
VAARSNSFLASLPDDRREQQLAQLWEILLMELSEHDFERFTKLTGWTPPPYMRRESKPYNPSELPGGLAATPMASRSALTSRLRPDLREYPLQRT